MRSTHFALALLIVVLGISLALAKEHGSSKKKVLKNRSELVVGSNETSAATSEGSAEKDGDKEGEKTKEKDSSELAEGTDLESILSNSNPEDDTSLTSSKPSYLAKVQNMLRRVLEILGLSRQKRKDRKMKYHPGNVLEDDNAMYMEQLRSTVGALLGKKDCLKHAACRAGSYLRAVKGKEVLIVLLEKFAPDGWADTVNQIKEAAIYQDPCNYRCLEE